MPPFRKQVWRQNVSPKHCINGFRKSREWTVIPWTLRAMSEWSATQLRRRWCTVDILWRTCIPCITVGKSLIHTFIPVQVQRIVVLIHWHQYLSRYNEQQQKANISIVCHASSSDVGDVIVRARLNVLSCEYQQSKIHSHTRTQTQTLIYLMIPDVQWEFHIINMSVAVHYNQYGPVIR